MTTKLFKIKIKPGTELKAKAFINELNRRSQEAAETLSLENCSIESFFLEELPNETNMYIFKCFPSAEAAQQNVDTSKHPLYKLMMEFREQCYELRTHIPQIANFEKNSSRHNNS